MKIAQKTQADIAHKIGQLVHNVGVDPIKDMLHYYTHHPKIKDANVAFMWKLLVLSGVNVGDLYKQGLYDSHITTALLVIGKSLSLI